MIEAHEFDNDNARKTCVFNSSTFGKLPRSRSGSWPEAVRPSRTIAGQRPGDRGIAVQIMSWLDSLARVRHPRVLVDAALLGNQFKTRLVEYRVVQDALACSSIIGSQGIELFREFATPKFSVEPVEEQCQESLISVTG